MRKIFTALIFVLFLLSCSFAAGVKTQPQSQSERISIFDDVRPSPVRKSGKMRVGGRRSDDVSLSVGDVMINPLPNTGR